jgi:hypothetical protein
VKTVLCKARKNYAINLHAAASTGSQFLAPQSLKQEIQYFKASDPFQHIYATFDPGPPMLKAALRFGGRKCDWESPISLRLHHELAKKSQLIRISGSFWTRL